MHGLMEDCHFHPFPMVVRPLLCTFSPCFFVLGRLGIDWPSSGRCRREPRGYQLIHVVACGTSDLIFLRQDVVEVGIALELTWEPGGGTLSCTRRSRRPVRLGHLPMPGGSQLFYAPWHSGSARRVCSRALIRPTGGVKLTATGEMKVEHHALKDSFEPKLAMLPQGCLDINFAGFLLQRLRFRKSSPPSQRFKLVIYIWTGMPIGLIQDLEAEFRSSL